MQQENNKSYPSNVFGRIWMKIPLIVRSVLTGFGISSLGITFWVLLVENIAPPWSVLLMTPLLGLYWMYFRGRWNPSNTIAFRRLCTRKTRLGKDEWIWGLLAAFFIVLILNYGWELTFRIYEFQPEIFKTLMHLNTLPEWQAWLVIIMGSLVAGICEEVGFRGYMQTPLEQKYGPVAGISITSVIFALAHIHQAWASGIMIEIFMVSVMIGYLAYATGSLLPGIIAHFSFDVINFSYWWSDILGTYKHKPISITGTDSHFILTAAVVLFSSVLFIFTIRKLLKMKRTDQRLALDFDQN